MEVGGRVRGVSVIGCRGCRAVEACRIPHSILLMTQEPAEPETRLEDVARRRLRTLRLARDWTLDELARRTNIGASTISRIETGHRRLAVDDLAELAQGLGDHRRRDPGRGP